MSKCARFLSVCFGLTTLLFFVQVPAFAQCPPPASAGTIAICMPNNGYTIDGPVELSAAANVNGLTLMRVYDNGQLVLYETPMSSFDTFLYVGQGLHDIAVIAYDGQGNAYRADTNITVTNGSAGQPCGIPPTDKTISFCYPTNSVTVGSPVTVSARARWDNNTISHIRLYMDNQDVYDADYQDFIFTQLKLAPGGHYMVAVIWNNQGQYLATTENFQVTSTQCTPTGPVSFCWPQNNDTEPTPIQITAAASISNLTLLRLYDNNANVFETPSSSFSTTLNNGQGLHHLVIVAYDSSGNAYTDERYLRVTGTGTFPCGFPDSGRDINICAPADFSTVKSPVAIAAHANWNGQVITHIRVYMDYNDVYDEDNQSQVYPQFTLTSGMHFMTIIVWDNTGAYTAASRTFFVQ